jgi:ribonuclease T2
MVLGTNLLFRPDHCNGGFDQFCDSRRRYSNISLILVDAGRRDLLDQMSTYWKDYKGDDPNLWEHEWNKHGTCVSTLETHCYSDYYPQQEVVDYFDKTVELFHDLPTFEVSRRCFRPISQPFFVSNYLTEL